MVTLNGKLNGNNYWQHLIVTINGKLNGNN